jgi:hypothetical protein
MGATTYIAGSQLVMVARRSDLLIWLMEATATFEFKRKLRLHRNYYTSELHSGSTGSNLC